MGLNINQILPVNTPSKNISSSVAISDVNSETDLCSSSTYKGMFSLPNMSDIDFPNIDLPKVKLDYGINGDFLPDFTKFKISGLKIKGLDLPYKCSIKDLSNPFGKSILEKSNIKNLNNVNCKDSTGGLNNNKIKNKYTEKAYDMDNCAKKDIEAISDLATDINDLSTNLNSENLNIMKSITKSVVNNKLDVGVASSLLNTPTIINNVRESIQVTSKPIGSILKVGNDTKLINDKNPILDYANSLTNMTDIASDTTSPIMNLAEDASMDAPINNTDYDTKQFSSGQKLTLLGRAKSINNNSNNFISKIKSFV